MSCGECIKICPVGAHIIENDKHIYVREKCVQCGKCVENCLGNALKLYGQELSVDDLLPVLLKDKEFYDNSGGGITVSGGECLLYADFIAELLKKLKQNGVNTAVDTCGFVSKNALDKVMPYTDKFLYDLKAVDGKVHEFCTGQDNKQILENLLYLDKKGCKIEIRIPFVPLFNWGEIEKMGELLSGLKNLTKVKVLAYHNYAGSKYQSIGMTNTLPEQLPTENELSKAKEELREYGLKVE